MDEFTGRKLEEKVFVICWKGKGDHSRLPAAELEMSVGELDLRISRRGVCVLWEDWSCVGKKCLLELGYETMQQVEEGTLEKEDFWDPQGMGAGGQGKLTQVFCCKTGDETEELGLGEQRR